MNLIKNRVPNYLVCVGKICDLRDECVLGEYADKDIYAQSVAIAATLEKYAPRQVKLFCWVRAPEEEPMVPEKAIVSLVFSDVVHELKYNVEIDEVVYPEVHYYHHTRTFEETNDVGVSLTEAQICYKNLNGGFCDTKVEIPPEHYIRIEPNSELTQTNKEFFITLDEETFTLKNWGVDDNGYDVYVEQSMCVNRENIIENC